MQVVFFSNNLYSSFLHRRQTSIQQGTSPYKPCTQLSLGTIDSSLLCLGYWSKMGYIKLDDLKAAASLSDVKNDEEWSDHEWSIVS